MTPDLTTPIDLDQQTFWVERDGQPRLHLTRWRPAKAKGVILRLHGIESHTGWYDHTSEALARGGHTVYFQDRRGSGKSEGERGDIDSPKTWLNDLRATINDIRWREGVETIHLLANCWGARLALAHATQHPQGLRSVALIAPALSMHQTFGPWEKMKIAGDALLRIDPMRRRHHPVWDARLFTRDEERVRRIEKDPLAIHECTARFFAATQRLTLSLPRHLPRMVLPTLALFGGQDQVLDLPGTQALIRKVPADLLSVKTYPGQWHMLEFEPACDQVVRDILEWLSSR